MNRRNFLQGVALGATAALAVRGDALAADKAVSAPDMAPKQEAIWPPAKKFFGRKYNYIIVDDPCLHEPLSDSMRAKQSKLLAKWYNSKVDTLTFRSLYHGRL